MSRTNMSATSSEHSNATTASGRVKRASSSASSASSCNNGNSSSKGGKQQQQQAGGWGQRRWCTRYHLNSVWSVWYCLVTLGFMGYLVFGGVRRFLTYAALPWPRDEQPYVELNAYVGLVGASVVVAPFYLLTSLLKVGNLANDGYKLGASLTTCSKDPPPVPRPAPGLVRNLWLHGVPTAPFLHLVAAFCLLLPRTLMQATLISSGFLPRAEIWKTDLDFLVPHNDRLMLMGSVNISYTSSSASVSQESSLPLPSALRSPQAATEDPRPPSLHVKTTIQPRSKHTMQPEGKSLYGNHRGKMYVEFPESGKSSYGNPEGKVYVVPGSGKSSYNTPPVEGTSKSQSSLQEGDSDPPRLPDIGDWSPLSPELLNYTIALLVFAIRYPSVFWHTNKSFGLLFSVQLIVNGIHTILLITAFTILYKLHVCGGGQELHGGESFLLNLPATVGLLLAAVMLVTISSSTLYLYGYHKFTEFVARSKQRYHIMFDGEPGSVGTYVPPCAALVVLVGLGLTHGPLLWDLSLVYRGSLDAVVLAAVIGTIVHLFLWVVLWLILTVKSSWTFKLRVTVARACVSSARSIKLVNDVELASSEGGRGGQASTPLLVVGAGKAYAITDTAPKKTIMGVVQKTHQEKQARGQEEEIYWLRPSKPIHAHTQAKPMSPRAKVTFDEGNILTSPRKGKGRTVKVQEPTYRRVTTLSDSDDEAGDYALLRETLHEPQLPKKPQEDPRYVDRQQILAYRRAMEERLGDQARPATAGPDYEDADHLHMRSPQATHHLDTQGPMTPRSTRSNDSGVVPEEQSQRSDSVSTSSSNTPPEHSEESGVHSGATDLTRHRSNSVDDLTQLPPDPNQLPTSPKTVLQQRPPLTSSPGSPYGYSPGRTLSPGPGALVYPVAESTVVIRRQRNLTQEIKPPVDPIYGSRPLTSFTDQQHHHQQQEAKRQTAQEDLLAVAQNSFNSSQSTNSSGYHSSSANPSSGSNSSRNSPVPQHPGPSISPGHPVFTQKNQVIYGQLGRPGPRVGPHSPQGLYSRTSGGPAGPQRLPQAPQIPLPPIPQGALPSGSSHQSSLQDLYGRTTGQKIYGHVGESSGTCSPSPVRNPVGRSVSLRASSGAVAKYNTPGGLSQQPRGSCYNTNV